MTRQELTEIVDRVHATWNHPIPKGTDQKTVYNAWWQLLQTLNADAVHTTITLLAIHETYMPKPGQILRNTVLRETGFNPPTPPEAWNQLRKAAEASHTGTHNQHHEIHPLVKQTITQLGGTSAYNLHTNGDRETFTTTYQTNLTKHETELITHTTHPQPPEHQPQTTNPNNPQPTH
jgi:hypothetical protein